MRPWGLKGESKDSSLRVPSKLAATLGWETRFSKSKAFLTYFFFLFKYFWFYDISHSVSCIKTAIYFVFFSTVSSVYNSIHDWDAPFLEQMDHKKISSKWFVFVLQESFDAVPPSGSLSGLHSDGEGGWMPKQQPAPRPKGHSRYQASFPYILLKS